MAAEEFQILDECLTRINHSVIQNLFRLFFFGIFKKRYKNNKISTGYRYLVILLIRRNIELHI